MNKRLLFFLTLTGIAAFKVAGTLEDLGTTIDEVKKQTVNQLAQDHFNPYYTEEIKAACKKLPVGVREATMASVGKIIRDYVESPQFKTDYQHFLDETYPATAFDANDSRWTSVRQQKLDELTKMVSNDNPAVAQMIPNMIDMDLQGKQSMLQIVTNPMMKEAAAAFPSPDEMNKDIEEDRMLKELFTKDKAAFKKKYPELMADREVRNQKLSEKNNAATANKRASEEKQKRLDYKASLRNLLNEFLAATSDIDFSAATKANSDGVRIFVNPAYEQKDGAWKFYYRCGKESIGGARKFAQNWLNSLH